MSEKRDRARWSIATILPIVLGGLILLAVVPVLLVGYYGTQDVTRRLLRDRVDLLIEAVVTPIEGLLTPVSDAMDGAAASLSTGSLEPDEGEPFAAFVTALLSSNQHISGISFVSPDGTLRRWSRGGHADLTEDAGLAFRKELLRRAEAGGSGTWSAPFFSNVDGEIVLSYRSPIRRDGQLLGLLTAAVSVRSLSTQLTNIGAEFDVVPFVLADGDKIVAHPALSSSRTPLLHFEELPTIETVDDPVMAAIWTERNAVTATLPPRHGSAHWGIVEGESYSYAYRELPLPGETRLVAGNYSKSSATQRDRLMSLYVGAAGLVLLLAALAVAAFVGKRLARPVIAFGQASDAIRDFRFDEIGLRRWETSRVSEIAGTSSAMRQMADAMSMFERYVPRSLVRRLIVAGQSSQPDKRELTVMFLDLEGYTNYSSGRSASEVAALLNELFATVGPIIEACNGTIDKYTGDGLMAFWGAPAIDTDHVRHGVQAALLIARQMEQNLASDRATGRPNCRVRIGLHSGEVIVGDLGYAGRIDYTVIGDTVNRAKRTEESGRGLKPDALAIIAVTREIIDQAHIPAHVLRKLDDKDVWLLDARYVQTDGGSPP